MDSGYPYCNENKGRPVGTPFEEDDPHIACFTWSRSTRLELNCHFDTWLMWTPPIEAGADRIPVPIRLWSWTAIGSSTWDAAAKDWTAPSSGLSIPLEVVEAWYYPKWKNVF